MIVLVVESSLGEVPQVLHPRRFADEAPPLLHIGQGHVVLLADVAADALLAEGRLAVVTTDQVAQLAAPPAVDLVPLLVQRRDVGVGEDQALPADSHLELRVT